MTNILVTGSSGLVGSACVDYYCKQHPDNLVIGVDNNQRQAFFGMNASTLYNKCRLLDTYENFIHYDNDIQDVNSMQSVLQIHKPDLIIHCAAQPSHDFATNNLFLDYHINATATITLLDLFKKIVPESTFIFMSTNKVYGDKPNQLDFTELEYRYDVKPNATYYYLNGIDEKMSIDNSKHSFFGCSKLTADIYTQEFGKYFGLKTFVFRGGCLTGPNHSGTKLHGFISYLTRCFAAGTKYTIFGYKGKQVRDNIHSSDLVKAFDCCFNNSDNIKPGEVFNIGGGVYSNTSILEAINTLEELSGIKDNYDIVDEPRSGDHIWYISDIRKFQYACPQWEGITVGINTIIEEQYKHWKDNA